ncbi:MAG: branched-chain amino acid aminotransferase [Erysipelotrichaceae bacterium]|jgi:branched-chain amino acid aminotransferase|nr:branched-chain amino acid aminotransferase [Erysipelotrichaceae bacterium]
MEIKINRIETPKQLPDSSSLGFGKIFTDHMFIADYSKDEGWHDYRIVPYGNLSVSPACTAFHYGTEIFEGLKAYRRPDGEVQLFRPIENARRMNRSAERLCMPQFPEEDFVEAVKTLVKLDERWVPSDPGTSLYIRPFTIGNDETLGVHAVNHATFIIILSPVGSYYKEGLNPVSIMIEDQDVRAVRGGTGEAKCGGNYAASNRAGDRAEKKGYSQVLWLDGVERKYIEEVGAMNVMFKINGTVVTPALSGSILPGITRKSIIEILKKEGYPVEERLLSVDELAAAMADGSLEEAWGCGTAAVVSPIGELVYKDQVYTVNNKQIGELTQHLYDTLTSIQWGKSEDVYNWTVKI